MGRREDIHEIVYEEDAQEIPVVEETRVTSSDFDKIKVTGMHQVTMQELQQKNLTRRSPWRK